MLHAILAAFAYGVMLALHYMNVLILNFAGMKSPYPQIAFGVIAFIYGFIYTFGSGHKPESLKGYLSFPLAVGLGFALTCGVVQYKAMFMASTMVLIGLPFIAFEGVLVVVTLGLLGLMFALYRYIESKGADYSTSASVIVSFLPLAFTLFLFSVILNGFHYGANFLSLANTIHSTSTQKPHIINEPVYVAQIIHWMGVFVLGTLLIWGDKFPKRLESTICYAFGLVMMFGGIQYVLNVLAFDMPIATFLDNPILVASRWMIIEVCVLWVALGVYLHHTKAYQNWMCLGNIKKMNLDELSDQEQVLINITLGELKVCPEALASEHAIEAMALQKKADHAIFETLAKMGVHDLYCEIHQRYVEMTQDPRHDEGIYLYEYENEALKRAWVIQFGLGNFLGIGPLSEDLVHKVYEMTEDLLKRGKLDDEFHCLLLYHCYHGTKTRHKELLEVIKDFPELFDLIKDAAPYTKNEYVLQIISDDHLQDTFSDEDSMWFRGLLGHYWHQQLFDQDDED